ncbi:MAG: hypothetical protein JWR84_3063 [Caulobacter sp.]|nr:hypothetical protein [Caulobacter sp.]
MTVDEMLAREEIRLLLATYNSEGDRGNLAGLASVFASDGVLEGGSGSFSAEGPAGIVDVLSNRTGDRHAAAGRKISFMRHHLSSSLVTFEADGTARGRSYFLVVTDIGPDHAGVYTDTYRKEDGRWRIAHRRSRIDWAAPGSHAVPGRLAKT